ncbi:quercetin dioxygenase-like cupin family protein [Labrys wisconsinensis]|uniref:Quercetin dioxygenase-like cupin family protein n=2 Tax=Labrys wisconsinensis TaxID=425677 RepID=A0ABU0JKD8_9HYPH|nr:quercetin dioxygenase-like cupin family protein [Labrys wisconsinensis]
MSGGVVACPAAMTGKADRAATIDKVDRAGTIGRADRAGMIIRRAGAGVRRAPDGIASGPFWVEMLLESAVEGENTAMRATLDPGVVTHWHSHPRGQILIVLSGVGLAQRDGGAVAEIRAGDCVWFAADERHWHGAAPESPFSYVSIQAVQGGTAVHWMEPVAERDPS